MILLDASVWLAAVDRDDAFHAAARRLVARDDVEHAALDLTIYEVANVAATRWRDPPRATRLARLVTVACAERLVRVTTDLADLAVEIAAEHALTVYDAAYVAVSRRERCTLVSVDVADLVEPGFAVAPNAA